MNDFRKEHLLYSRSNCKTPPHKTIRKPAHHRILPSLVALASLFFLPFTLRADDTITWCVTNWPPVIILDETRTVITGGVIGEQLKLIQKNLPGYTHANSEMLLKRLWPLIRNGEHVLHSHAIKTPAREKEALFSLPINVHLPCHLIMKDDTWNTLGSPASLALRDFLQNNTLKGTLICNRSYGQVIDQILSRYETQNNIERQPVNEASSIKMLLFNRGDYLIDYPSTVFWIKEHLFPENSSKLISVRIQEVEPFGFIYIAAPKNAWGKKVIGDINNVLKELVLTKEYRSQLREIYNTDQILPLLRKYYDEKLIPEVLGTSGERS